jgi:hypothetical protein
MVCLGGALCTRQSCIIVYDLAGHWQLQSDCLAASIRVAACLAL